MMRLMLAPSASLLRLRSRPVVEGSKTVVLLHINSREASVPLLRRRHHGHACRRLGCLGGVWSYGHTDSRTQASRRIPNTHSARIFHNRTALQGTNDQGNDSAFKNKRRQKTGRFSITVSVLFLSFWKGIVFLNTFLLRVVQTMRLSLSLDNEVFDVALVRKSDD